MQETLFNRWITGFFDAEGCARVNKSTRKNGITYLPRLNIVNTDFETVETISAFLKDIGINHYINTSKPTTNRKPMKNLEIGRIGKVAKFSDILLNSGAITKRKELELLREFCVSRMSQFGGNVRPAHIPYSNREKDIYCELTGYKAHRKGKKCLSHSPKDMEALYDIDTVWLAGFTDGDGSFSINKRGSPSYCIGSTSWPTANSLRKFFSERNIEYYYYSRAAGKNHLPSCKLTTHKLFINKPEDILAVLDMIEDYLITKKVRASLMREFCLSRKDNKNSRFTEREIFLKEEMKRLNKDPSEAICETFQKKDDMVLT